MFSFLKALKETGCRMEVDATSHCLHADDKNFYYRYYRGGLLQIGVKRCFDRWANSIDFVCKLPKNEKMFDALMVALQHCLEKERYDPGMGQELNINYLIRKARRGKL